MSNIKAKTSQLIMVWLLPVILIGGIFFPHLGYLVAAMFAILLAMSYFKGRYWCAHFCPRGAFLDIVMAKMSANKPFPGFFIRQWFRWLVLILLMGLLIFRIARAEGNLIAIGAVFVSVCILTTLIAIIIAALTKHRGWCAICPMGTLQEKITKIKPS